MAGSTDAVFAATPKCYSAVVPATADTSLTAPTHGVTLVTAGANGTKIEQIRCIQIVTGPLAISPVNLFLYDGTTYHLFDFFSMPALTNGAAGAAPEAVPLDKFYQNLVMPTTWSLVVTVTLTASVSGFNVVAFGGDF